MNWNDLFRVTLPETALEIAALLIVIVDLGFLRKATLKTRTTIAALLGVAGCIAGIFAAYHTIGAHYFFALFQGGYITVSQIAILALTALTLLLFIGSSFTKHAGEYVAVVLMAAAGGLLISGARDLLIIFIGLELLSLGLYVLTAFAKSSGKSAEAALKYYLFGGMSAAMLLFGFSYLYGLTGSTQVDRILRALITSGPSPLLYVAWILIIAGLGFKIAAVPFHLWAPDTYEGAPAPAAAFIASVSKVASFSLLLSLSWAWFVPWSLGSNPKGYVGNDYQVISNYYNSIVPLMLILLLVATASMVIGNLAALVQTSVRRLLAYSAIAHAGYILLGIATVPGLAALSHGHPQDLSFHTLFVSASSVLYYVITYGLTTIGAFGVIAVVEKATGSDAMDAFSGLHKRNPILAGVLLILFLSLAGIPPLVGFWAKFNLFAAVLSTGSGVLPLALVALAIAMSAVSLYYYLQVLKRAYVLPPAEETPIRVHPVTMMVLVAIAAAVVGIGCFPSILQNWINALLPGS